ncbi:MAG: mycofactocin system FadH/OYE family oxidoreductase 1 [Rhodococcus sp. (in: high G+C Gram-positive bacteria)]
MIDEPISCNGRTAACRVMFGPHETNLAVGRAFSEEMVAYYERRARGGTGIVVTEGASVHPSDWPYERSPLAAECDEGWAATARACHDHGSLVLAGLSHTGSQGSSAYSRSALWGPSRIADVSSRELPREMDYADIALLTAGFAESASRAMASGMDGIELDVGPRSLLRQFLSGLTNRRADRYGTDRSLLLREVLAATRAALGDGILALRLSCDEGAPWAGIVPGAAISTVADSASEIDMLVVVRGSAMTASSYRPDFHQPQGFNRELCRSLREAVGGQMSVVLQGSVVDAGMANDALRDGTADLVEMTRAQIADPDLVATVRIGRAPRPCVLCNQSCQVRDPRNPLVQCIGRVEDDPLPDTDSGEATVVGGGVAGLEAARVLAVRGFAVTVRERTQRVGGMLAATPLRALPLWLESECRRLGVDIVTGVSAEDGTIVATGSRAPTSHLTVSDHVQYLDAGSVALGSAIEAGPVLVFDPVGGPIAVDIVDRLVEAGREVSIVTPDDVVGRHLSMTGDMVASNVRFRRAGVTMHVMSTVRSADAAGALLENVHTGERSVVRCAVLVDCSAREALPANGNRVGDCLAPRTALEAVREGHAAATAVASMAAAR